MNLKYAETLVIKAKQGDEASKEQLVEEFKPFIINQAKKFIISGYDFNDLMSECYKNLFIAIENYNVDKHRFVGFATISIQNALKVLLRNSKIREEKLTLEKDKVNEIIDDSNFEESFCEMDFRGFVRKCFNDLEEDEQLLIKHLYYDNRSVRAFSMENNVKYNQVARKKRIVLEKLKNYIEG